MSKSLDNIDRLRLAVSLAGSDVFVIIKDLEAPDIDIALNQVKIGAGSLLQRQGVSAALSAAHALPAEINFCREELKREHFTFLNQQRAQFVRGVPTLIVVTPSQVEGLARYAPDLWKWAHVIDLSSSQPPMPHPQPAVDELSGQQYAPRLDPSDVVGPAHPLRAPAED